MHVSSSGLGKGFEHVYNKTKKFVRKKLSLAIFLWKKFCLFAVSRSHIIDALLLIRLKSVFRTQFYAKLAYLSFSESR